MRGIAFALALLAAAAGCDRAPSPGAEVQAIDISGASYPGDLALTDHGGQARTLADFAGRVVILVFGFTQCPDVCPTTLGTLKAALQQLGGDAGRVQVLFLTIDPERDTRELLAQYVPAFDARFLGLYADAPTTARVAQAFKVGYQKVPGSAAGSYTLDHTAYAFVIDPRGRLRLKLPHGQPPEAYARIVRELLAEG